MTFHKYKLSIYIKNMNGNINIYKKNTLFNGDMLK